MTKWLYSLLLGGVLLASYFWLQQPTLAQLTPQVILVCLVSYALARKLRTKRLSVSFLLPSYQAWETSLLLAAVTLLIGATGGLASGFLVSGYLAIFVLVFSSEDISSLLASLGLGFSLLGATSAFNPMIWSNLLSLPVVTGLLILAKNQYLQAVNTTSQLLHDDDWNSQRQDSTGWFVQKFLVPTIAELKTLTPNAAKNQDQIHQHILRIESRTNQLIEVYQQPPTTSADHDTSDETPPTK